MTSSIEKYCSEEWCRFAEFYGQTIHVKQGEYIFKEGEVTQGIYIIRSGNVKVTTSAGKHNVNRLIRLATVNDIVGHRGFGGDWKYTVSGVALTETELLFIPLKVFNFLFRANPDFAYYMMTFFAEELRDAESFMEQLPVKNTVAKVLLKNLEAFGLEAGSETKLSFTLSRKDLASLAGTRYETLVRILADFNQEKLIRLEGKSIHILNSESLRQMALGIG